MSAPVPAVAHVAQAQAVNPPPAAAALAVWVLREIVALVFVAGWLLMIAGELLTGGYTIPFWLHVVGVGVLAYALGINAAQLTSFTLPTGPLRAAVEARA